MQLGTRSHGEAARGTTVKSNAGDTKMTTNRRTALLTSIAGVLILLAGCVLILSNSAPLQAAEDDDGWVDLLPENDLSKHWSTTGNWSINEDGVVTLTPRPGEKGWSRFDAYLWLDNQYQDFEIEFDYMVQPHGNSGFYFHVGDKSSPVAKGIEVQIYDSHSKGPNARLGDHDSGGIIPGIPPTKNAAKPAGEWNTFHITCKGRQLTVKLNGEVVNEVDLDNAKLKTRPSTGYIGFQDHALPLSLRKIRIRKL